jgi:hypothetical protein
MRHRPPPVPLAVRGRMPSQPPGSVARTTLGLWPVLVQCQPDLVPRVAVSTAQVRALPRRVRRALQRQWRLPLVGIALVLALGQLPVQAATIPVSDTCTLVDAIRAANTDRARGGCPAGSGADTLVLPVGSTQTLRAVQTTAYGPSGLPAISSPITIEGHGSTLRRAEDAPAFRMLTVNFVGKLTLRETTVSGGVASGEAFAAEGGGVWNYGILTVTHSTISGNAATGSGGGVFSRAPSP